MIAALLPLISRLTKARADKLDNLDAAISGRSTNAGVWSHPTRTLTEGPIPPISDYGSKDHIVFANTGTFTVPPNVYKILAICVGGGGNGKVSGGGGGGYTQKIYTTTPGTTYNVVVGAPGGNSSFTGLGFNLLATGGGDGLEPANSSDFGLKNGGTGGVGSGGDINFAGGNGGQGGIDLGGSAYYAGSGGASGSRYGIGGNGDKAMIVNSGEAPKALGGQVKVSPFVNILELYHEYSTNVVWGDGPLFIRYSSGVLSSYPFDEYNSFYGNGGSSASRIELQDIFANPSSGTIGGGGGGNFYGDTPAPGSQGLVVVAW